MKFDDFDDLQEGMGKWIDASSVCAWSWSEGLRIIIFAKKNNMCSLP